MNILKFEIREDNRVDIFIDQRNLIEILKEYEKPFAKKEGYEEMAGWYDWLFQDILYENLELQRWEKPILLWCQCGEEGCWPIETTIKKIDDTVIWTEFEQPFRKKDSHNFWDYSNFGSFTFDKENYQSELKKLES